MPSKARSQASPYSRATPVMPAESVTTRYLLGGGLGLPAMPRTSGDTRAKGFNRGLAPAVL
jgi:hypothetical protein